MRSIFPAAPADATIVAPPALEVKGDSTVILVRMQGATT